MPVLLAALALGTALLRRWARRHGTAWTVEALVIVGAALLAAIGLLATLMTVLGWFSSQAIVLVLAAAAALAWPWGQVPSAEPERLPPPDGWRVWAVAAGLTLATLALRVPAIPAELGGRDQGTYVLRARHTLHTGELGFRDPVLASAGRDAGRPGPGDILGLFPRAADADSPDRRGRYEAAYRPGFYLTERATGEVVPQFLHLHPMLLATFGMVVGPDRMTGLLHLEALLAVLALWSLGRRLWPRGPWATIAASLYVLSPLAVWVHRTPLTEPLTGLLLLASALALARGLRTREDMTVVAALLLGMTAWVRGNAWLTAPVVLAILWFAPAARRRTLAPGLLFASLVASLALHVVTCYPYLYDELHRQLGRLAPLSLSAVGVAAVLAAAAWYLGDRLLRPLRGRATLLPGALVIAAALAILVYAALAMRGAGHSRLDPAGPLLGVGLLLAAIAGALRVAALRAPADTHAVWLLALASIPVVTLALYAQRNLPQATLYYYGRYLHPELLPLACLLAAYALQGAHVLLSRRTGPKASTFITAGLALALLVGQAWPYVAYPVTRLQEFAGAQRAVDALAAEIPEDAIVIAGGEGWHSAHTFNQIGGALALGRGRSVLPYRSQEAAYATLHELLVTGPAAHERLPPRVFLLLNESSHIYRPRDEHGVAGDPVAAIDDRLPAPFVARPVGLVELLVDRLTPVTGVLPTRVTRADLRMALFEVEVDDALRAAIRAWAFTDGAPRGPDGLRLRDAKWEAGTLCLDPKQPLTIDLPTGLSGHVSLVLVSGTGAAPERWSLAADGVALDLRPPAGTVTRDTLGPFALPSAPRRLTVHGAREPRPDAPCPHGSLAGLRLLPPDTAGLARATTPPWVRTFAPAADLGHPVVPVRWVAGRSLSRARPGTTPAPTGGGLTLPLHVEQRLDFAWSPVPGDSQAAHDLVLNLRDIHLDADARIEIFDGDAAIAGVDPPDRHEGAWQSPPLPWRPRAGLVRLGLVLRSANDRAQVQVRDLALFARGPALTGVLAPRDDE